MITLGLDVGFASLGWALFVGDRLDMLGVIVTEAQGGETSSEGLMRRSRAIAYDLRAILRADRPVMVVMESVSWPRSGSVIGKIGAAYGAVSAAIGCEQPCAGVLHLSPQAVRKGLGLGKGADKDAILTAVREAPGCERLDELLAGVRTKALRRHPTDACAVVLAARALRQADAAALCG